jgi:proteasome lid subunit RPN8/RPN11
MRINIPDRILTEIQAHGISAYPEEGAGLMLGEETPEGRHVKSILGLENAREDGAKHNRYLLTAEDMLQGEKAAAEQGLSIIGIFHSHPDHPDEPSEFDREWAIPWYSYLITSVRKGVAAGSRSWRLRDDRSKFEEEELSIISD